MLIREASCPHPSLAAEPQLSNQLTVAFEVGALEIIQQAAASANHGQKAVPSVVILGMGAEMVRERIDTLGEHSYLDTGRSGVFFMLLILLDHSLLVKTHV